MYLDHCDILELLSQHALLHQGYMVSTFGKVKVGFGYCTSDGCLPLFHALQSNVHVVIRLSVVSKLYIQY